MKNFEWFKNMFISYLEGYEVNHRFFEEGDFGSLNQIAFDSQEKGGEIDFWSNGQLSILFVDYKKSEDLLNIFLMPSEEKEKDIAFQKLRELL